VPYVTKISHRKISNATHLTNRQQFFFMLIDKVARGGALRAGGRVREEQRRVESEGEAGGMHPRGGPEGRDNAK
jgi:hypothetical protein